MMLCRRGVLCRLVVQLLLVHAWTLNVSASEHREELRVLVMSENRQPDIIAAEETESALLDQGVTEVNVTEVRRLIRTEPKPDFMGYGITDPPDGLVIHHFDLRNISYPLASGGFLISPAISRQIKTLLPTLNDTDYVLDAYYSLADFVKHGIRRAATNSTSHALPEPPPSEPMHAWPKFDNYCVATDGQPLPWINVPVHVDDVNECQWACIAFDDCSAVMWFESGWDGSQCKLVLGADREHTEYTLPQYAARRRRTVLKTRNAIFDPYLCATNSSGGCIRRPCSNVRTTARRTYISPVEDAGRIMGVRAAAV
eukprot:GEMP01037078.1.p1 GENE.GEMP01037078.1~~GEMP01037078.1.p1  ORF type:complete len:336 (+),score=71.07 GEMP01037078.1:72-1010(+)